jgi:hypothetical protein
MVFFLVRTRGINKGGVEMNQLLIDLGQQAWDQAHGNAEEAIEGLYHAILRHQEFYTALVHTMAEEAIRHVCLQDRVRRYAKPQPGPGEQAPPSERLMKGKALSAIRNLREYPQQGVSPKRPPKGEPT